MNPILLMTPVAIAISYGFIMPIATPPNAIVFGNRYVTASKMARFGLPLNLISILVVTIISEFQLIVCVQIVPKGKQHILFLLFELQK